MSLLGLAISPRPASSDAGLRQQPARVLLVAAQAALVRISGTWDVGTGGGALLGWRRSGRLALIGAGASALAVSDRGGGAVAAELALGLRGPRSMLVGLTLGPTLELDAVRRPRLGAHAAAWMAAGVVPYVRVSALESTGFTVDLGLAVVLPTLRW